MLRVRIMHTVAFLALTTASNLGTAGPVAPNDVCLYDHISYVNKLGCFSLEPGMRQLLVPSLGKIGDRAASIHVGENVMVVAFPDPNFEGPWWFTEEESRPALGDHGKDIISSLIVAPKGQGIKGVRLHSGVELFAENDDKFLPLPQYLKDTEAHFELTGDWNDRADMVKFYGDVELTLYEHHNRKGAPLTLPGKGYYDDPPGTHNREAWWMLGDYKMQDKASSAVVRDIHALKAMKVPVERILPPPQRGGEGPGVVHRAPPAPRSPAAPAPSPGQASAAAPIPSMKPTVASRMSAAELGRLLRGNTLKARLVEREVIWTTYFRPDGVVFARSERGIEDTGNWMVKEDLYCTQYQRLSGGKQSCYWVARDGGQFGVHNAQDGRLVGIAKILRGNPEKLGYQQ